MEQGEIIKTASKLVAYALQRRKSNITVETPVLTYDDLRAELQRLQPEMPTPPEPSPELLELLNSPPKQLPDQLPQVIEQLQLPPAREDIEHDHDVGVACIPCTVSHIATCAGQLNEAIRFARDDIANPEVGMRIDNCLSEIAAAERIDLAPSNVVNLPDEERKIANDAAKALREVRHTLEWYKTYGELEGAAAAMSRLQHSTSQAWREARLSKLSDEQLKEMTRAAQESVEELLRENEADETASIDKG